MLFSPLNNNFAPAFEKTKANHLSNFKSNSMRQIAFRQALREALQEEMRRDERVFLMGEEVAEYNGAYKVSQGLLDEFGEKRVIDTPIAELGFTAIGVGAAQNGLRPVLEFMTWNFAVLALDQILNTASKMLAMSGGQVGCPIVFRGPNGSAGQLGAQHSTAFESYYANIPGLKVVSVSNPYDAKGLLKAAIRDNDPVVFMESEQMYGDMGEVPEEEYIIPIGKADIKRAGRDVTIVSFNKMMKVALGAAEELAKEGIEAEVIDLRTIRPLDWFTILESVKKTNRLVIVEEQWPFSSISSEISYRIQKEGFDYLDAPIRRITAADAPMHYAPNLVKAYLPDVERTVKLVKEVMYMKK
ncbi:pyruvate dehydrogenase complex E1 component subunit beta [Chitinophaga sancti]|uniref:Pyruvate dehydrogenase complex E1 component subunit beta n=2 Tax=Chitinophaga sancti TaxID=1004 RepID=A0ABZ0XPR2_9BACT|nr:pyruvate dehydrogenase complex E1 component subunit beta [Chitinophaga sancti]WQG92548.1 pyruvate dehydrogenase complex E1 component subunit beta [Chitinophaga sancti]